MISLPALQALVDAGEETFLVVRSPAQLGLARYISGLAGTIPEPEFLSRPLPAGARYINLRDHPLQTEFRWDTPEFAALYPDYRIMEVAAHIASDKGVHADFHHLQPLAYKHRNELKDTILLVPGSSHDVKCWPAPHWQQLAMRIGNVRVIGEPGKSWAVDQLVDLGLPCLSTPEFADLVDAVSSALAVVSIDTGPMHLAIQQSTPTVGLYLNNPFYLRRERHAFALVAPFCSTVCHDKSLEEPLNKDVEWTDWAPLKNWQCEESESNRCMTQISVDSVIAKLNEAIAGDCRQQSHQRREESLLTAGASISI